MIENPHVIILSLGLAGAMIVGAYWVGRTLYEDTMKERDDG